MRPVNKAIKRSEKLFVIQQEIARERDRHANKSTGLARQRDAVSAVADPVLRPAKLAKLASDTAEENARHTAKLAALNLRTWRAWR